MTVARRNLIVVFSALAVVAGLGTWSLVFRIRAESALTAAMSREHALRDQRQMLIVQLRPSAIAEGPKSREEAIAPSPLVAGSLPAVQINPLSTLAADPKLQSVYFQARRANFPFAYGPLIASLALTPEQAQHLEDLIIRREEDLFDTLATVPSAMDGNTFYGGGSPTLRINFLFEAVTSPLQAETPDVRAALTLLQRNEANFQEAVASLLGPDKVSQLMRYEHDILVRDFVDSIGKELVGTQAPLEQQQAMKLTQILADADLRAAARGTHPQPEQINWEQAISDASAILSPNQLSALEAKASRDRLRRRLNTAVTEGEAVMARAASK